MTDATKLARAITAIPPGGYWWKRDGQKTFETIGQQLLAKGFTVDEAATVLAQVYHAVAAQFGE